MCLHNVMGPTARSPPQATMWLSSTGDNQSSKKIPKCLQVCSPLKQMACTKLQGKSAIRCGQCFGIVQDRNCTILQCYPLCYDLNINVPNKVVCWRPNPWGQDQTPFRHPSELTCPFHLWEHSKVPSMEQGMSSHQTLGHLHRELPNLHHTEK